MIFPRVLFVLFTVQLTMSGVALAESPDSHEKAPELEVRTAIHTGAVRSDTVEWHSRYEITAPDRSDSGRMAFASPLPVGAVIETHDQNTRLERDSQGRIVAVTVRYHALFSLGKRLGRVELDTTLPVEDGFEPPLGRDAPQRVELEGVRVRPDADSALELRLTDVRHHDITSETVGNLNARWGNPQTTARPIFIHPDRAYFETGGLTSSVRTDESARKQTMLVLIIVSALALVIIGLLLPRLWRAARAEEAEAFLRDFGELN